MSEIKLPQDAARPSGGASSYTSFLYRQLPHIVVMMLAISGVAYTNISHQPLVGYWEFDSGDGDCLRRHGMGKGGR